MDLFEILKEYVNIFIPVVFMVILEIVKALLENQNIKPKDSDTWVWIILALGLPMAFIELGIAEFKGFNLFKFILSSFAYSAASALVYKVYKVGGKKISELFKKDNK